jgi:hypothetical protein
MSDFGVARNLDFVVALVIVEDNSALRAHEHKVFGVSFLNPVWHFLNYFRG